MFDLLKNLVELWGNSPDIFITTLIYLACGVGGVCGGICLRKTSRETSALNQAKQDWGSICAGNSGGDIYADIRQRAEEKLPAATLVKSRVIDICEWYQKNSQDETPQLQDLRRNSFSKMEIANSAFILSLLTSVLLIVGICGTLCCVHTCLAGGNQVLNNLSLLGNALNPSKWAISFTIVLLILRGIYRLRVSRLLWHLDEFTIKHIIPDLQQRGDISQTLDQLINSLNEVKKQMKSFSSSVSAFQNTAESLGAVTEAIESSNADFKDQIQNVQDEYGRLEATINSAQDVWNKLGETILQTAEQGLTTSNTATALLNKQQENLQARERETAALLALTKKAQDLQTTTSGVADMVTSLAGLEQDIPRLQQQMATLQTALTEENADTEQALSRMQEEQKQLTAAGNTLQQGMEQLNTLLLGVQGSTRRIEQQEEAHAAQLAAYEGQMKQYDVTMGNYGVAMIGYGTKMSEYAAAMEQYAATMQDNATKITAYETTMDEYAATMSGYDAKMDEYAATWATYEATMHSDENRMKTTPSAATPAASTPHMPTPTGPEAKPEAPMAKAPTLTASSPHMHPSTVPEAKPEATMAKAPTPTASSPHMPTPTVPEAKSEAPMAKAPTPAASSPHMPTPTVPEAKPDAATKPAESAENNTEKESQGKGSRWDRLKSFFRNR